SGDLTYFAPWGNLAFFYKDSDVGYANGLIFLGKMDILPNDFSQKNELKILISQVK
ncbi:MAG: cyclophilin-like fold protein, partial [Acinetobacter sp.]